MKKDNVNKKKVRTFYSYYVALYGKYEKSKYYLKSILVSPEMDNLDSIIHFRGYK